MTYSPEQLQAMSVPELTATAATVVMKWEVIGYDEKWSSLVTVKQDDGHITQHWEPTKDWNHTMQLMHKVAEVEGWGFHFSDHHVSCGWNAAFGHFPTVNHFDPQRAITIAAILASQSSNE